MNNGLATIVDGGFDTLRAAAIPGPVVVAIAFRATGLPDGQTHELELTILGPSMTAACDPLKYPFGMTPGPQSNPGWEINALLPLQVIFQADVPGPYAITASIDGSTSKSITIRIVPPDHPTP